MTEQDNLWKIWLFL